VDLQFTLLDTFTEITPQSAAHFGAAVAIADDNILIGSLQSAMLGRGDVAICNWLGHRRKENCAISDESPLACSLPLFSADHRRIYEEKCHQDNTPADWERCFISYSHCDSYTKATIDHATAATGMDRSEPKLGARLQAEFERA
jgi:hypothetical protein